VLQITNTYFSNLQVNLDNTLSYDSLVVINGICEVDKSHPDESKDWLAGYLLGAGTGIPSGHDRSGHHRASFDQFGGWCRLGYVFECWWGGCLTDK
jgi:hypothetical protein